MNNIEALIEEQKKKSIMVNSLAIDLQYIQSLTAQIFSANASSLPEYDNGCIALRNLCDKVDVSLKELKAIVPAPEGNDGLVE